MESARRDFFFLPSLPTTKEASAHAEERAWVIELKQDHRTMDRTELSSDEFKTQ